MAPSLFSGSSSRSTKSNGKLADISIEEQLGELRSDVATLVALLADRGAAASKQARGKAQDAREQAEAGISELLASGEDLLAELRDRYAGTEKQVRHAIREHPLATLGAAALIGLAVAALLRR
ncbi:YqjD family protein [Sinorhizobium sp. GL28]|uniref:DUF883 family protein n=1 Tax=Sinorhizobium sp. GL28 TaxID=1358418 RepID=UPI00071D7791|nr:DUF883 family protein [Sinorhizobium sp. GL28]KSV95012.1 hypothetical protein N184_15255 [Sinorhizobium sp. GL28]